jgi:hypothetical protein
VFVAILILVLAGVGQAVSSAGTPQDARGPGTVSGQVIDADSREPLADVEVGTVKGGWVRTDAAGRYAVTLSPGRHALWIRGHYIASAVTPSVSLDIEPGSKTTGIDFRVRLESEISGRVVDEQGRPVAGADVVAVIRKLTRELVGPEQQEFAAGFWPVAAGRRVVTDSDGRYRLGVYAGRSYFVLAYFRRMFGQAHSDAPADPALRQPVLAATYHPTSPTLDRATAVVPTSSTDRTGIDITMRSSPAYCIDATLMAGGVPRAMQFTLEEGDVDALMYESAGATYDRIAGTSAPDGRMRVCDLPVGKYRIVASAGLPGPNDRVLQRGINLVGSAVVEIADRDVRGVVANAMPYPVVRGEVVVDEGTRGVRPIPLVRLSTFPRELSFAYGTPGSATFALRLQADAHYTLLVDTLPSPYYVRDITFADASGERSIFAEPFVVPSASKDARLRLNVGADAGTIGVRVLGRDGKPARHAWVLILPATARNEAEFAAFLKVGTTDSRGAFNATRVRPADYWILATDDPPPAMVRLPQEHINLDSTPETMGLLMKARPNGRRLTIVPNTPVEVTMGLTSWR